MKTKLLCLALVVGWLYCSGQKKGINRVRGIVDSWKIRVYSDTTGTDYKDLMMGKSGLECIGLFERNGKFYMKPTRFKWVKDYDEGRQDSVNVAVTFGEDNCYLLFKDFIDYNSEPINAVNEGKLIEMRPNTAFDFTYNGVKYKLKTEGEVDDRDTKNYKLYICSKRCKKEQVLVDHELVRSAYIEILFIGDLDGDSKPDIILNAPTNYENRYIMLFLSFSRRKGELLNLEALTFYWYDY